MWPELHPASLLARTTLKGQCHEVFDFWFFSWISFPQASEYTITAISNFFENSWRYSRLKVHHRCRWHRWQMEKIFKHKDFSNFIWAPLGSRVNKYINFCLQVHFKVSAAWYCPHYLPPVSATPVANLPPVSLIPVAICHRRRWHRWQIFRRCRWHWWQICCRRCQRRRWQIATGVNNTSGTGGKICRRCRGYRWQICHRCHWHRWCTLTCEYLREFSKKFEMTQMLFSEAWGKVIHGKNLKQKISWHCPFKSTLWTSSLL